MLETQATSSVIGLGLTVLFLGLSIFMVLAAAFSDEWRNAGYRHAAIDCLAAWRRIRNLWRPVCNMHAPAAPQLHPGAPAPHRAAPSPPGAGTCPVCGTAVPGDTPQGLCPACLMQCALSRSDHDHGKEKDGATTPHPYLPVAPTPAALAAHFPDLEILQLLGQGGMGAVYQARQRKLDRLVALKILPLEWGRDPAFAERFAREARALARLNHPHIVGVHDFGEAGGHFFLIMEYVDGPNLRQQLAGGRLQAQQALPIVMQTCEALQYAHEHGIVHRDIKPENILLDQRGQVKIADFGLAKLPRRAPGEWTLTGSRQVMGTLDYMAPEQRTDPQAVDHRADVYSLGVLFYEMLTGELPLGRFAPPSQKAGVDGRLDDVINRALDREPDRRYQRISAVRDDVASILRDEGSAPPLHGDSRGGGTDLALAQIRAAGPAAGLAVFAVLLLADLIWLSGALHPQDRESALFVIGTIAGLGLFGAILVGAAKFARCCGYPWVMFAVLLALIPIGPHMLVSIPVGIWALRVLRRSDVQAAFLRNWRGAGDLVVPPADIAKPPEEPPAAPAGTGGLFQLARVGGKRVRSYVLSVFSMVASRSVLGVRSAPAQVPPPRPLAPPRPPVAAPAARGRRWRRLALWIPVIAGVLVVIVVLIVRLANQPARVTPSGKMVAMEVPSGGSLQGLQGDLEQLGSSLQLATLQLVSIQQVLRGADKEYLELELAHTSRKVDTGGKITVNIEQFREQADELEARVRARLRPFFAYVRMEGKGQFPAEFEPPQLPPRRKLFAFGHAETTIELWKTGGWYYWKASRETSDVSTRRVEEGNGAQLPRKYQRFWQNGPPVQKRG